MAAVAIPSNIRVAPQADLQHESAAFLRGLFALARAFPNKVFNVFSGYRGPGTTGQRSATVGGFTGDPHERGIAADINVGGQPIGAVFSQATLAKYGLLSGNTPNFYQGKTDPSHLQLASGSSLGTRNVSQQMTGGDFANAVLRAIGAPLTAANRLFIASWAAAEGTRAKNNPLATTQPSQGASNFNSVGVKNYPSFAAGVAATAKTLTNGRYPFIVQSLRENNANAITSTRQGQSEISVWGTNPLALANVFNARSPSNAKGWLDGVVSAGGDVVGAVTGAAGDVVGWTAGLGSLLGNLIDPHFWLRVLEMLAGGVLALTGLYLLAKQIGLPTGPPPAALAAAAA